jgi:riboflavin kinase/FMN adenylyltransferase
VIHGDKRGRTIGFPTANIELDGAYIIPPTGVYAVRFQLDDEVYNGVCNIGYKPTFYDEKKVKPSIEVHIFEFNKSIYGKNVSIFWYKRIRSEQKFSSIDELIEQIGKDKASAEQFFQDLQD